MGESSYKKKLLVYAHYYYPDVASTGQILTELCEGMKNDFDITVICVVPSYIGIIEAKYKEKKYYFEEIKGVNVVRVKVPEFAKKDKVSRVRNLLAYFFRAIGATSKIEKQDYVFAISQPPVLGGVLGVIGKFLKGGKLIYNIQDFNPEQTMAVGYAKNKVVLSLMMAVDKFTCKRSDKVIVVGRDMQETLRNRFKGKKVPVNTFINNWIDEKEIYPLEENNEKVMFFKKRYGLDNKVVVMYSGNIGLYYDLENIIKVIGRFNGRKEVVFAFVGEGTVKDKIVDYASNNKLDNVVFIPYQPKEDLNYSLNAGDIHWVVNAKGIKGVSVPSKLYGVMAAGKTVLGVLEEGSEGRMIIDDAKCGLCVEPGDYDGIYEKLNEFIEEVKTLKTLGLDGRKYIEKNINKEVAINKYVDEILTTGSEIEIIVDNSTTMGA